MKLIICLLVCLMFISGCQTGLGVAKDGIWTLGKVVDVLQPIADKMDEDVIARALDDQNRIMLRGQDMESRLARK